MGLRAAGGRCPPCMLPRAAAISLAALAGGPWQGSPAPSPAEVAAAKFQRSCHTLHMWAGRRLPNAAAAPSTAPCACCCSAAARPVGSPPSSPTATEQLPLPPPVGDLEKAINQCDSNYNPGDFLQVRVPRCAHCHSRCCWCCYCPVACLFACLQWWRSGRVICCCWCGTPCSRVCRPAAPPLHQEPTISPARLLPALPAGQPAHLPAAHLLGLPVRAPGW